MSSPFAPRALVAAMTVLWVVIAAAACSKPPARHLPPNVRRAPDGSCWFYPPSNCPPAHLSTCEAEVPRRVRCP